MGQAECPRSQPEDPEEDQGAHDAPGDVRATWANIDKARSLLDWEPQVARLDGLADCVAWYRAERAWAAAVDTSD